LTRAQEEAGVLAERVADDAKRFEEVSNHLSVIKVRMKELWLSAAEELLPALEKIAAVLHGLDLGPVGAAIGAAGPALIGGSMMAMLANLTPTMVNWSLRLAPLLGQNLALGIGVALEGLGGLMAAILPVGLAAAITYAVVSGLEAAYLQSQKNQEARANQQFHGLHQSSEAIAAATTEVELAKQREEIEKKIAELKKPFMVTGGRHGTHFEKESADDSTKEAIAGYEKQLALIDRKGAALVAQNKSTADAKAAAAAELATDQAITAELIKHAAEYEKKVASETYANLNNNQKLTFLTAEGLKAKQTYDQDMAAARALNDQVALRAAEQKYRAATLEIEKEFHGVQKKITEEAEKQAKANAEAAKKTAEEATKRNIQAEEDTVTNGLSSIAQRRADLDADFTKTAAQKWGERKALLAEEIALREKEVETYKKLKAAADASGNPTAAAQYDASGRQAQKGLNSAIGQEGKQGPDPNSFADQLQAANTRSLNSIKTLAEQVGEAWDSVASGMRSAFAGAFDNMLTHGGTFKSFMGNLSLGLLKTFDQALSQMVANWVMSHLVMENVKKLFGVQDAATTTTTETIKTTVTAAGATQRTAITVTETTTAIAANATKVTAHVIGEQTKTGSTLIGSIARRAIGLGETIYHMVQVAIRTAGHIAGQIAMTAASMAQTAIRIGTILVEAIASVIQAGAGAMSAVASIPYVGPILAVAALAAVIAAGMGAVKAIGREAGGPVTAGKTYLVGERRPELFVPGSNGYIFPSVGDGLARAGGVAGAMQGSGAAMRPAASGSAPGRGGAAGGGAPQLHQNLIIAFSPEDTFRAIRSNVGAEVAKMNAKQSYRRT
jgi:hypothetical protein